MGAGGVALPLGDQHGLVAIEQVGHGAADQHFAATRGDDNAPKAGPKGGLEVQR